MAVALACAPALAVGGYGAVSIIGSGQDTVYVLYTGGSAYDIGYWHGSLLRAQVQHNISTALAVAHTQASSTQLLAAWGAMAPYVSQEFNDELQGLADGSGVALSDLREMHALPDLSEFHCSAFNASGPATANGHMLQLRNLDYSMDLGIQDNPLVIMATPTGGHRYANITFAGFIGSIAGISSQGIGVSEMGDSFDYANETLAGIPMPFLLRNIIAHAASFAEALTMIQNASRTSSLWYTVGDADAPDAALFQTSPTIFNYWRHGAEPSPLPALPHVVYGGHYNDRLYSDLSTHWGSLTPAIAIAIARNNAMASNLMDAVYDLTTREIWVAYAEGAQPASAREFAHLSLTGPEHPAAGYRTAIGAGADEIPVVVVSGTPYEMGYQCGALMTSEVAACLGAYLSYYQTGDPVRYSDANLDAAWTAVAPHVPTRFVEEMQGLADGAGISYDSVRRAHCVSLLEDYACSGVALWGAASADGHLYQIRNLDYTMDSGMQAYPAIVVYLPNSGTAYANVGFAGYVGSIAGMNAQGIAITEMGDTPGSEYPFDLNGVPFFVMFRNILQDAASLSGALQIVSDATRIKKYHYVIGSGDEPAGAKLRAWAPNLDTWTDNDPTDELYPNVLPNVVYQTMNNAAAWSHLNAYYGSYDASRTIELSRLVHGGGNLMDVVYDATARQMWVAFAEGVQPAYQREYVHFNLYDYLPSTLTAQAGADKNVAQGGSGVTLEGSASGGTPPYTFAWTPATGLDDATKAQPLASPAATTTYTLTVTDAAAHTDTDTVTVHVLGATPLFDDVEADDPARGVIEALYNAGITGGCLASPSLFCPNETVTRGQMAVFVTRAAGVAPINPAMATFDDVPRGADGIATAPIDAGTMCDADGTHQFYQYVEALADPASWAASATPPTTGCQATPVRLYCPQETCKREQVAAFLCRAMGKTLINPLTATFSDVATSHQFYQYIETLADPGSWTVPPTTGCLPPPGDPTHRYFCPSDDCLRSQMAWFIVRAFDIPY
jgi:hypothetical protein